MALVPFDSGSPVIQAHLFTCPFYEPVFIGLPNENPSFFFVCLARSSTATLLPRQCVNNQRSLKFHLLLSAKERNCADRKTDPRSRFCNAPLLLANIEFPSSTRPSRAWQFSFFAGVERFFCHPRRAIDIFLFYFDKSTLKPLIFSSSYIIIFGILFHSK